MYQNSCEKDKQRWKLTNKWAKCWCTNGLQWWNIEKRQQRKYCYKMKPKLMQIIIFCRSMLFPNSIGPIDGRNYLFLFSFLEFFIFLMDRQQNGKMWFQNSLWLRWCDKCVTTGIHYSQFANTEEKNYWTFPSRNFITNCGHVNIFIYFIRTKTNGKMMMIIIIVIILCYRHFCT